MVRGKDQGLGLGSRRLSQVSHLAYTVATSLIQPPLWYRGMSWSTKQNKITTSTSHRMDQQDINGVVDVCVCSTPWGGGGGGVNPPKYWHVGDIKQIRSIMDVT